MTAPVKRKGRPQKKAHYGSDASGRDDDDDMTDLSFHSDTGDQFSEEEEDAHSVSASIGTGRKRGRPRSIKRARPEERKEEKREESIAEKVVKAVMGEGEIDELGESRVDKDGHLRDGREYKIPAFSMPSRGDELLMLGKDVVALLNMRDSFVLVNKNPLVVKVDATQEDKNYLIEHGYLRSTFRTRDITIVSARSIFKTFGHRVIKKGRRGRDDYFATGVPEEDSEAEDEKEEAEEKKRARLYTKTSEMPQDTAFGAGASSLSFRRSNLTNRFVPNRGPPNDLNWIFHAALSVRDFNAQLREYRSKNPSFYDVHTHIYQTPASMQPQYAVAPTEEALNAAAAAEASAADQTGMIGDQQQRAESTKPTAIPDNTQQHPMSQPPQGYPMQAYADQQASYGMNMANGQIPFAMQQQARLNQAAAAKMIPPNSQAAYMASMSGNNPAAFQNMPPGQSAAALAAARQHQMAAMQGIAMSGQQQLPNAGMQLPGQRLPQQMQNPYGSTGSPMPQQNAPRFGVK
ncbi:unnamed protein product [Umbelopsis ramanniana]